MKEVFLSVLNNVFEYVQNNSIEAISTVSYIVAGVFALVQWNNTNENKRIEYVDKILKETHDNPNIKEIIEINDYETKEWYCDDFHHSDDEREFAKHTDETLSHLNFICYLINNKRIGRKDTGLFDYNLKTMASNINTKRYMFDLYQYCLFNNREFPYPYFLKYCVKNGFLTKHIYKKKFYYILLKKFSKIECTRKEEKIFNCVCQSMNLEKTNDSIAKIPLYIKTCNRCDFCKTSKDCNIKDRNPKWLVYGRECSKFDFDLEKW